MQNMTKSDVLAWWQSLQQQLSFAEGGRAMAQKELDSVQEDLADAIKEASQSLHRCSAYRLLTLQTDSREQSRGVSHATALDWLTVRGLAASLQRDSMRSRAAQAEKELDGVRQERQSLEDGLKQMEQQVSRLHGGRVHRLRRMTPPLSVAINDFVYACGMTVGGGQGSTGGGGRPRHQGQQRTREDSGR